MAIQDETLIRQYARGDLAPEDAAAFESRLSSEPELRENLEVYLALQARDAVMQKQRWKRLRKEQSGSGPGQEAKVIRPVWSRPAAWISMAAAVLALVAVFWLLQSGPDAGALASQYLAQGYPAPEISMGAVDQDSLWREASAAYRSGNFGAAVSNLEAMAARDDEQNFYLGMAYLFQDPPDYQLAIASLEKAGGNYTEAALYYMALSMLETGREDQAKALLETLREGDRKAEVEALLKGL